MAISEDQLKTWANAPSSTKSIFTHEEVREALEKSPALKNRDYEVYLQGSYANSTNIKLDSDVDIVVQLNEAFGFNASEFHETRIAIFREVHPVPTYGWADFRKDVIDALNAHFGILAVKPDVKCIKIPKDDRRVNADVTVCLEYHKYNTFDRGNINDYVTGMKFHTTDGKEIFNYPKIHLKNGEDKNLSHRTDQKYKHIVRIIKNIRQKLIENGTIDPKIARSYFIECAVYNVPDGHFNGTYKNSLEYTLDYILNRCTPATMLTVSHQHNLFGNEPWQWNTTDASTFFTAVNNYYQNN